MSHLINLCVYRSILHSPEQHATFTTFERVHFKIWFYHRNKTIKRKKVQDAPTSSDPFHLEMHVAWMGVGIFLFNSTKKMQSIQWTRTNSTDKVSNLFEILSFVRRRARMNKRARTRKHTKTIQLLLALFFLHRLHSPQIPFSLYLFLDVFSMKMVIE